jgi:tetratricopeptide (TPR) repeat protein
VHQAREEWAEALEQYEATLALVPTHRDALLGKTVTLSQLDRYEEALVPASHLIDLGNWFIGPSHYWRAWNLYQLDRIDTARIEADRAKALMVNPSTFVLSGMIEWRLLRLESAEKEFQSAIEMDYGQCEAAWFLGGVRAQLRRLPDSLGAFQHAVQCFDLSVIARREAIAKLSATPAEAAGNARLIASHQQGIADAERRRAEAAQSMAALQKQLASAAGDAGQK